MQCEGGALPDVREGYKGQHEQLLFAIGLQTWIAQIQIHFLIWADEVPSLCFDFPTMRQ